MNLQLGKKMKKYFFRLQCYERGTKKKNRTHRLSYNINSHKALSLPILAVCGMCHMLA